MKRHTRSDSIGRSTQTDQANYKSNDDKLASPVKRRKSHTNFLKAYLIDYTANSNLHGLKYIGEKERTPVEKIFWLFMFTCSVVLCAGLIMKVYNKWNDSPVIVSFSENLTPVWKIPYPAVTVCPETKSMQTKFNFTEYYYLYHNETTRANLTDEERNMFEDISIICDQREAPEDGRMFSLGNETVSKIKGVAPNISEQFLACRWEGVNLEFCSELLSLILTEEGVCYTFNTLSAEDLFKVENLHQDYNYYDHFNRSVPKSSWNLEDGYSNTAPLETFPHRGMGYGARAGLTLLMQLKSTNFDYLCKGPVQGFKVLVHNPAEVPSLTQQYFKAPFSQEVIVAVKPKMIETSPGLRSYDPDVRKCYFSDERYLRYFKIYTQANCEMECLTNFTYAKCGCVHFGMPHGPDMVTCNAGKVACMKEARMDMVTMDVQNGSLGTEETKHPLNDPIEVARRCKCMDSCTSLTYEVETSQADFDWRTLFRNFRIPITDANKDDEFSRVVVFFKEALFITSRRSELYGVTDFLANCGGLLGLFMGFSVLSVTEILYFLSLRVWCLLRRKRQNRQETKEASVD